MQILLCQQYIGQAASAPAPDRSGTEAALVQAGNLALNLMMNAGPNSTTFLLSEEMFPTEIRAARAGFVFAATKAGEALDTLSCQF